jgi:uncharacterized membrane protein YkoI
MKHITLVLAIIFLLQFSLAQEKPVAKITKEQATKTALERVKNGMIKSSELEKEAGKLIWSFDIELNKKIQEVWVDANTGEVVKTEAETTVNEKEEKAIEKAEKAALKKVPGEIVKKETKKEKGKTVYSFEIKNKDGKIFEVDVNAKGKVLSVESADEEKDDKEKKDKK